MSTGYSEDALVVQTANTLFAGLRYPPSGGVFTSSESPPIT